MAQSLARIVVHIIFSTKHRKPMIPPEIRRELAVYLAGTLKAIDSSPLQVTCVADHVHILCCLSRTVALAKLVEEVKKSTSKWMKKKKSPSLREFYWQGGYGAFSVSQSNVDAVRKYVSTQEEHHRQVTFQQEFRAFLTRHQIDYDERCVWD